MPDELRERVARALDGVPCVHLRTNKFLTPTTHEVVVWEDQDMPIVLFASTDYQKALEQSALWPGKLRAARVLAAMAPEMAVVKAAVAWECADDRPGGFWDDPVKSPAQAALIAAVRALPPGWREGK